MKLPDRRSWKRVLPLPVPMSRMEGGFLGDASLSVLVGESGNVELVRKARVRAGASTSSNQEMRSEGDGGGEEEALPLWLSRWSSSS